MSSKLRIKWLNLELTEAILIRGRWRWRRIAQVRRKTSDELATEAANGIKVSHLWVFTNSELPVAYASELLELRRDQELAGGLDGIDWIRPCNTKMICS